MHHTWRRDKANIQLKKLQNKSKKEIQIYTVEDSDIMHLKIAKISQYLYTLAPKVVKYTAL